MFNPPATERPNLATGEIFPDTIFFASPLFRATNLAVIHTPGSTLTNISTITSNVNVGDSVKYQVATGPPAVTEAMVKGSDGVLRVPCDPLKWGTGPEGTRYRVSHAYLTIQVVSDKGISGDLIMAHATHRLIDDYTPPLLLDAIRRERHSTVRYPLAGGWQKTFTFPMMNPESYGEWGFANATTYGGGGFPNPAEGPYNNGDEHNGFGGFIFGFENVKYSAFVTPPSINVSVMLVLEEELSLSLNDLACNTVQKTLASKRDELMSTAGIKSGTNTSGHPSDGHKHHHHNRDLRPTSLRGKNGPKHTKHPRGG